MVNVSYTITCRWDDEAGVWYVEESDVPGLATEAPTLDEMERKLLTMIPELLELNEPDYAPPVSFEVIAHKRSTTLQRTA